MNMVRKLRLVLSVVSGRPWFHFNFVRISIRRPGTFSALAESSLLLTLRIRTLNSAAKILDERG